MLPVILIVVIAVPLVLMAYAASRRSRLAGEHPVPEDDQAKERIEQEFAEAEEYQEHWREEEKKHQRDTII